MPTRERFPARSKERTGFLTRLWELGRVVSTQTVFLHQAIAQRVGLNATDTKCIDLISRGPPDGVTAGWLSEHTGLTTGAITHILDRLERRAFIARQRDTADRRKVFVRLRPEALAPLMPLYEGIGRAFMALAERYSDRELRLICEYYEEASRISERERLKIIAGQPQPAATARRPAARASGRGDVPATAAAPTTRRRSAREQSGRSRAAAPRRAPK
jgi:DNA-binding MarR family transcriptional regulator